ncbi:putative glutathione S-transferase DHAR2, chloroplastic isoform X2 [Tasmannia lanceolata]|uniref:putative glutathione S-transferase DHAR2, chloroplastic isoform X2 n=1 Tax=Tasmannia lanceolata TaxID=3420 RepID=UPI004063ADAB
MSTASTAPAALSLPSSLLAFSTKRIVRTPYFFQNSPPFRRLSHFGRSKNRLVTMAAISDPLELCVKESVTTPNRLGDCPFTQRVLLTLEEKHLPYDVKLVNLANKPEWFLKINPEGKVPIIKLDEKWIADSDVITQTLEEKFPDPQLSVPPEKASVGSKIFPTFIGFLKSKDPNDGTEQALLNELSSFNDYIKENSIFSKDSFIKTQAHPEDVVAGWRPKVEG